MGIASPSGLEPSQMMVRNSNLPQQRSGVGDRAVCEKDNMNEAVVNR
jgi:hypothetical protein